jgi:hypothetical protein
VQLVNPSHARQLAGRRKTDRLAWLLDGLPVEITGPTAQRPGHVLPGPAAARAAGLHRRAAARAQARFLRPADLAGPGGGHRDPEGKVRHRDRDGLGTAASAAGEDAAGGRTTRRAAPYRGHRRPAPGRSHARPARRWSGVAMVLPCRHRRGTREPDLAGVPSLLRYRAHVQVPRAGPGLGRPKVRDPAAADGWTWLTLACYAQLYIAWDPR